MGTFDFDEWGQPKLLAYKGSPIKSPSSSWGKAGH